MHIAKRTSVFLCALCVSAVNIYPAAAKGINISNPELTRIADLISCFFTTENTKNTERIK